MRRKRRNHASAFKANGADIEKLHAGIGQLTLENDFYPKRSEVRPCVA